MAIKYVENYRKDTTNNDLSDTLTIQASINDLEDGDSLIFEQGRTYVLDEPVSFTSYNPETRIGTTRNYLEIDGNGCTVCGSNTFNSLYGNKNNNTYALFYISDKMKNGITNSVIKNFIFNWKSPGSTLNENSYPYSNRNAAIAVVTPDYANAPNTVSVYYTNGNIEKCIFNNFGTGIYMCGKIVNIEQCQFYTCYIGINSDGTTQLDAHLNYFETTRETGLLLNTSYRSNAYENAFYKCRNNSIFVTGPSDDSTVSKVLTINIYSNKIIGGEFYDENGNITKIENQTGILCSGGKDVIIRDNVIRDMTYDNEDPWRADYGIGILLYGNNISGIFKTSQRVIVSNNIIAASQRFGIKVGFTSACTICGNSMHSGDRGANADYGIYIQNTAGDLHVSDNALYDFADNKFMRISRYNTHINNNTFYYKSGRFDPFSPMRYVRTNVSSGNPSVIHIPELPVALEDDEEFYMFIPNEYSSSTVTSITYNGLSGYVYNGNSMYNFSTSDIGKYIKLKYSYGVTSSDTEVISFTIVE